MLRSWVRRADVRPLDVGRAIVAGVLSQISSAALTIGAPLLLIVAWDHRSSPSPLRDIAIPLVVIEILAFLRSPLRYLDRVNAHRLGIESVTTWRSWLTERVSQWSFRTFSSSSRAELLSQSIRDIESLQNLWVRIVVPVAASLMGYLVITIGTIGWMVLTATSATHIISVSVIAVLTILITAVMATRIDTAVALVRGTNRARWELARDLQGRHDLAVELSLLQHNASRQLKYDNSSLRRWSSELSRRDGWWLRFDTALVGASGLVVVGAAAVVGGVSSAALLQSGIVVVLFASLTGDLIASARVGLESSAQLIVTALDLEARGEPTRALRISSSTWPTAPVTYSLPGVLTWSQGAIIAVVGPSGSGKSTWLRRLARLDDIDVPCTVNDRPMAEISDESFRARVIHVATEPQFLGLRLSDEMLLGRTEEASGVDVLRSLELPTDPLIRPNATSRGERHRYAIARALMREPELLLLDEPTAGLGHVDAARIIDVLRTHTISAIIATHDPHVIALCDHVIPIESLRD